MHRSITFAALLAILAVNTAPGQDQSPPSTTNTLPTVLVTGARLPDETIPLDKYPANVTVITSKDIDASPGVSILDILRQESGVFYSDTVGFSQSGTKLNMRGYSDKPGTLVLVDGVRVTDAGDGTFLWNSIPLGDIERIEIIRGGASTTYGEGAIGGVVNIVTKHPSQEPFGGIIRGAGGNLGYYTSDLQASGTEGIFGYRFSGERQAWDGWRAASRFNSWSASAAPSLSTVAGRFTLDYRYFQNSSEDPGNLTHAQYQSNPRQQGAFQTFSTNWIHRASLNYEKPIGNDWAILTQIYAQKYDAFTVSAGFTNVTRQPNFGATLQTTYKREFAGHENTLTFGSEAVSQDFHQVSNFSTSLVDYWTASGFVQDTFELGSHLTLTGGARYDYREWQVTAVDTAFGSYNFSQGKTAGVWSGKVGLNYALAERSDAWFSISRAFRLPTGSDISAVNFEPPTFGPVLFYPNPNIKPVDARTAEAGLRTDYSKWLGGSIGYFYSEVKNDIVFDPFSFENVNFNSLKQGVEFNLHSRPNDWFGLYVNAAWTDAHFDGGVHDGKRLPHIADYQVSEGINLYPASGCTLTFEALHVIGQVVLNDLDNLLSRNTYTVLNAKASYELKPVTVFGAVNNLLDSRFELFPTSLGTAASRKFNPAPGINFQVGASFSF